MTPDDLAAIRARDAELDLDAIYMPESHTDRRALLAEVDRLTAERDALDAQVRTALADGKYRERVRISAAVEALPTLLVPAGIRNPSVDRAAVIAIVGGGR